jgi:hypothetical protein
MMNWKGCGRKWLWPNLRYYPSVCLEELRKTMKTSVKIPSVWAKISTWDLLSMKQEHYPLDHDIQCKLQ